MRNPPYITLVTKKQIWHGNGRFHKSDYPKGLLGGMNLKIPSKAQIEKQELFYGYRALNGPWGLMNGITNNAMRQYVLMQVIDGDFSDIRPILGRGYVRKDGTLDPEQTKGISCYVLFLADKTYRDLQNNWLRKQPFWKRAQVYRNITTHVDLLQQKKMAASKLVKNNQLLLGLEEYRELIPNITREEISWESDE